jgi:hypothetical protein
MWISAQWGFKEIQPMRKSRFTDAHGNGRRDLTPTRTLRTDPAMSEEVRRVASCFRP